MNYLNGYEGESLTPPRTQVYQATHKDDQYLPYMNRSFISFSYGGKNIEDFNLLATIDGDRLSREAYSSFDDLTTTYDTIQGQFYWGSYYRTNTLTFNLATDGITQVELDEFRHWFQPGKGKELILAEHPNRAINARVSAPPQLNLLPFEKKVTLSLRTPTSSAEAPEYRSYNTSTTLFKGEIQLTFVMDEPFWYAKQNILGDQDVLQGYYTDYWTDANKNQVLVRETPDALKIIYEDRIPLGSTTNLSVFLGGNVFATVVHKLCSTIAKSITQEQYEEGASSLDPETSSTHFDNGNELIPNTSSYYYDEDNKYYQGAVIATVSGDNVSGAVIDGANLSTPTDNNSGITLSQSDIAHLYYAGTAPSPLKIRFQLTPIFSQNSPYFIQSPYNENSGDDYPTYNTIIFKATREHHFNFSLPSLYSSYNQVQKILQQYGTEGTAWLTIREYIRDQVKHPIMRAWANAVINTQDTSSGTGLIVGNAINTVLNNMRQLFYENSVPTAATFEFDGKTGKAKGTFKVRDPENSTDFITIIEDVGDMVKSSYLILDERNVLDDSFQVQGRTEAHPDYSYEISHNLQNSLEHVQFEFKNLYL